MLGQEDTLKSCWEVESDGPPLPKAAKVKLQFGPGTEGTRHLWKLVIGCFVLVSFVWFVFCGIVECLFGFCFVFEFRLMTVFKILD